MRERSACCARRSTRRAFRGCDARSRARWGARRVVDANLDDWSLCIRPAELRAHIENAGLVASEEVVGIAPHASPPVLLRALRARRKGRIDYGELGRRLAMGESRDRSILYAGYAHKP